MTTRHPRKPLSGLALAIALATGTAVVATAVLPAEAQAQRAKKRDKKKKQDEGAPELSDEFRKAFLPVQEGMNGENPDYAALKPQIEQLIQIAQSNDEKFFTGNVAYNAGARLEDQTLQLTGMELMLAGGKVPADQLGRYNFIAYQLANGMDQYDKARRYLQASIDNNFTTDTIGRSDLQIAMAESYFGQNSVQQGLDYLSGAIADKKAAGEDVPEQWYRRGITVAYENQVTPELYDMATMWIADYPSTSNWRDAINLTRNLNTFEGGEILDLLRLSRRVEAMGDVSDYEYYVEAADPRRLPKEVRDVIEEGYASGTVSRDNLYLSEALELASGRIESDRADLPALETDAMAADAGLRLVAGAADAFLSYDQYAKAETFYEKALAMPGVEKNEAQLRLAIAKIELGKYDEARELLAGIEGKRAPIAKLWAAYADAEQGSAASPMTGG
ncbi:tetratricopeptide repeat protein [Erythrobacter sp.]|uniref:tetratricopeptide repeat protein n=1 Tax=Erythrobacter sp. TaxID=1042 RepID=UPI001425F589|nr:tetratricopeptide repeat protein [Erythrobacter sp.]QIQ86059.1 MAG: tetratricopeptide repeat protein [Erythrobacter sp.]